VHSLNEESYPVVLVQQVKCPKNDYSRFLDLKLIALVILFEPIDSQ